MPFELDKAVGTMATDNQNGGQVSSSGPDHQLQVNNSTASAHSKGNGSQSATITHSCRSRSDGDGSSNMSLLSGNSRNSLLDNADDGDEDGESDDDLGPVTRKAFTTCSNITEDLGASSITPSGPGGLASIAEKRASILRGCGTCCTSNGLDKPTVSPADNLKSLARRGVCFSDNLVTDTHEVPRTESAELNEHFYTNNDYRRFKRQARDEGHCEQQLLLMLRDFCSDLQDQEGDFD